VNWVAYWDPALGLRPVSLGSRLVSLGLHPVWLALGLHLVSLGLRPGPLRPQPPAAF
jgi:hypothetical protein